MNQYLIKFTYDAYCQGYEEAQEYALISANTFEQARNVITMKFYNAKNFENLTFFVNGNLIE